MNRRRKATPSELPMPNPKPAITAPAERGCTRHDPSAYRSFADLLAAATGALEMYQEEGRLDFSTEHELEVTVRKAANLVKPSNKKRK